MDRSYRIGEFAELAGVTVRALHHYDRIGLLRPQRSASGTRLYCLADLERLEQIAALKFLGIPLQEIKLLLKHGPLSLVESLHVQLQALAEKRRADPDIGCAFLDGHREITAHAHRKHRQEQAGFGFDLVAQFF